MRASIVPLCIGRALSGLLSLWASYVPLRCSMVAGVRSACRKTPGSAAELPLRSSKLAALEPARVGLRETGAHQRRLRSSASSCSTSCLAAARSAWRSGEVFGRTSGRSAASRHRVIRIGCIDTASVCRTIASRGRACERRLRGRPWRELPRPIAITAEDI